MSLLASCIRKRKLKYGKIQNSLCRLVYFLLTPFLIIRISPIYSYSAEKETTGIIIFSYSLKTNYLARNTKKTTFVTLTI